MDELLWRLGRPNVVRTDITSKSKKIPSTNYSATQLMNSHMLRTAMERSKGHGLDLKSLLNKDKIEMFKYQSDSQSYTMLTGLKFLRHSKMISHGITDTEDDSGYLPK